jgi:hypothetical protein
MPNLTARALHRDLQPFAARLPGFGPPESARLRAACDAAVANVAPGSPPGPPALGLFHEVRHLFAAHDQLRAYAVIDAALDAAASPPRERTAAPRCRGRLASGARCRRPAESPSHMCARHRLPALVAPPAAA